MPSWLSALVRPMLIASSVRTATVAGLAAGVVLATGPGIASVARAQPALAPASDPASIVSPFIGTNGGGNESPGARAPFGMVTWGPDTPNGADGGGYRYSDSTITGFSLTHLSGVGCKATTGEIPVLPTMGAVSGTATDSFSHSGESAAAGYYSVALGNGVGVGLTATARTGMAQFSFPATTQANLIFKLSGDGATGTVTASSTTFNVLSPTEVSGQVTAGGFCGSPNSYTVYFDMRFSQPMVGHGSFTGAVVHPGIGYQVERGKAVPGAKPAAPVPPNSPEPVNHPVFHGTGPSAPAVLTTPSGDYLTFDTTSGNPLLAKVGLSYVSVVNAASNLAAENSAWNFSAVETATHNAWNSLLGKIAITGGTSSQQQVFYTALYRALSYPSVFSDDNGQYRGMDRAVHVVDPGHSAFYTNFSGWDIYRSQAPLEALLDPQVASDTAQSMVDDAAQGGVLPKWVENNTETHIMVGDPADPILASYYAFGATNFDTSAALAAMVKQATDSNLNRPGLGYLTSPGYLPSNGDYCGDCNYYGPVSTTLEYATDDFAISALAGSLGKTGTQAAFQARAQNWQNLFNPASKLMQPRNANGSWVSGFSATSGAGFVEGDSWQYTGMVPFNLAGLAAAMGGDSALVGYLNSVLSGFTYGAGLTAGMGNEPSIGLPWEYDYAGQPYQTQETVRKVQDQLWADTPGGLPGNDDLGTMSAWFVWSALGMYPMTPGTANLALGSPMFSQAVVTLPSGATLTIDGNGAADNAPYVQSATWNGATWSSAYAPATALVSGGTLAYSLGTTPNQSWAASGPPPSYGVPNPPSALSGVGPVVSSVGSDICLDDANGSTANGNKIDISGCNGTGAQIWSLRADGTVQALGKCLDAVRGGTANGTLVDLYQCNGTSAQRWQVTSAGHLVNGASGKCLNDPASSTKSGVQVELMSCGSAAAQDWRPPYSGPQPLAGALTSARSAAWCIEDLSGRTVNGNPAVLSSCNGLAAQRWSIVADHTVRSALGGCLDVVRGGTANGTLVDYYACNNSGAQLWLPTRNGTLTTLVNPASGKCLTDPAPTPKQGTQLDITTCTGSKSQGWKLP